MIPLACEYFDVLTKIKDQQERIDLLSIYLKNDPEFKTLFDLMYRRDLCYSHALADLRVKPITNMDRALPHITFREFLKELRYLEDRVPVTRQSKKREKLECYIEEMHKDEAMICLAAIKHEDAFVAVNEIVVKAAYEKCGFDTSFFQ